MTVAGQTFGAGRTEEGKYYIVKLTWYGAVSYTHLDVYKRQM